MRFCIREWVCLWVLSANLCFLIAGAPASAQQPEDVLRQRVKEFYTFLQQGQISRAEPYVTQDSLDALRRSSVGPLLGFEISSVQLDPSGESATVTVQILYRHPMVPQSPLRYPRTTTWRLEDQVWRAVIVAQEGGSLTDLSQSAEPPHPEELQFSEKTQDLGVMEVGDKKPIRFSFKNITDHPVTISGVETGCPCLTLRSGNKTYQPGNTGELVLEFDSTDYLYNYKQTIVVKTEPGHLTIPLMVQAQPMPRRSPTPAPQPSSASPSGPKP